MRPAGHLAEMFVTNAEAVVFHNIVSMLRTVAALSVMGTPTNGPEFWKLAIESWQSSPSAVFTAGRKAKLDHAEYTTVHGMANLLIANTTVHRAARKPEGHHGLKVKELYSVLLKKALDETQWKDECQWTLYNPIFNYAEGIHIREDRARGIGRYSPTIKLLIEHLEFIERALYGKVQAAMDVG